VFDSWLEKVSGKERSEQCKGLGRRQEIPTPLKSPHSCSSQPFHTLQTPSPLPRIHLHPICLTIPLCPSLPPLGPWSLPPGFPLHPSTHPPTNTGRLHLQSGPTGGRPASLPHRLPPPAAGHHRQTPHVCRHHRAAAAWRRHVGAGHHRGEAAAGPRHRSRSSSSRWGRQAWESPGGAGSFHTCSSVRGRDLHPNPLPPQRQQCNSSETELGVWGVGRCAASDYAPCQQTLRAAGVAGFPGDADFGVCLCGAWWVAVNRMQG
jgi:hypothetical protein